MLQLAFAAKVSIHEVVSGLVADEALADSLTFSTSFFLAVLALLRTRVVGLATQVIVAVDVDIGLVLIAHHYVGRVSAEGMAVRFWEILDENGIVLCDTFEDKTLTQGGNQQ